MEHSHTKKAINARLTKRPPKSYLRDWIYGGIDGAITTFAIVSGVTGAHLSVKTILILGIANLVADGFSMAASNYLGTKSEHDQLKLLENFERDQIQKEPVGEKEEVRQILVKKGFSGTTLEAATNTYTAEPGRWINLMLSEEYGLSTQLRSPLKAALTTFTAFCICGLVPLLPFIVGSTSSIYFSMISTAGVFFFVGSFKAKWSIVPWWRQGFETLAVGSIAAVIAFVVGILLG